RVDWADPNVDWHSFDAAVIRQTWDYFDRLDEFLAWLERVGSCTRVVNPAQVIRWNCDKRYLVELADAGVPTVPTIVIERQAPAPDLAGLFAHHRFPEAVIKPVVSGAGRETYRVGHSQAGEHERTWQRLVADESMLFQPFMPAIVEHGEVSLVVIDGEVTHAVRKSAAPGEFRVQDDHGGTVHVHAPSEDEVSVARRALAATPEPVTYARVDLVGSDGGPLVMELELIEPELFFRHAPGAAGRLARSLDALLYDPEADSAADHT
ncbi:MAG: ATP-grasp domain-containing protein, partial [Wenzhouxiangella sp.]